jgi:hypothetical protein
VSVLRNPLPVRVFVGFPVPIPPLANIPQTCNPNYRNELGLVDVEH